MRNGQHPDYSEKAVTKCHRCDSTAITILPANNPGSDQEWFRCGNCDHMWSQRRNRAEQGERPPTSPEREGNSA